MEGAFGLENENFINKRKDRAYIIDQTGTGDEAIKAIHELLTHSPDHGPAHYRLGELLLEYVALNDVAGTLYIPAGDGALMKKVKNLPRALM